MTQIEKVLKNFTVDTYRDYKIDSEFENMIPKLKVEEFEQLEANIIKAGVIFEPAVLWTAKGHSVPTLLDGHNRRLIAEKHKLILKFRDVEDVYTREDAKRWIIENQIGRRNLTKGQFTMMLHEMMKLEKKEKTATLKQNLPKPQNGATVSKPQKTSEKIAKKTGVSKNTVERAHASGKVLDTNIEVKQEVIAGKLSVKKGVEKIKGMNQKNKRIKYEITLATKPENAAVKIREKLGNKFADALKLLL